MRVLDSQQITVSNDLVLVSHDNYQRVFRGAALVCDDSPDTHARASRFALDAGPLLGKTVAWIGGGLCVGPSLFAIGGCKQTVYEFEPALAEFCPSGVTFIPGDWRVTMTTKFDLIVYDLPSEVPLAELESHLNPGGIVLCQ